MEHQCKREELEWDKEPLSTGDTVYWKGKCPTCGKEYEQVFTEVDGLWDTDKEEYVFI